MQLINLEEKLAAITALAKGQHDSLGDGACVMEAVAYVAGEPWSDHPQCACPILGAFLRSWNDALSAEDRERLLRPLIPQIIGTRSTKAVEARRATMAADWYVRVQLPAWLRLAGLTADADAIAALPEITSFAKMPSIRGPLEAAQKNASAVESAARSAAWSAVESAARSAAWSAAESAAWSAAWSAAESAAWSAAWSAAESAAWSAAESAAEKIMEPVRLQLQESALDLVKRMIAVTEEKEAA